MEGIHGNAFLRDDIIVFLQFFHEFTKQISSPDSPSDENNEQTIERPPKQARREKSIPQPIQALLQTVPNEENQNEVFIYYLLLIPFHV